jgi:hypothetical protein
MANGGIEQIIPWYSNCGGLITTSSSCDNNWWGNFNQYFISSP